MIIESDDVSIGVLLKSRYLLIPRFQRPYSWERDHVTDFWNDAVIDNTEDNYFIGSMVSFKHSRYHYGIVDGQQRLTTAMILLCIIRDRLTEYGFTDEAEGLHTNFIERKNIDNKNEYILKTETSFPYFQGQILSSQKVEVIE